MDEAAAMAAGGSLPEEQVFWNEPSDVMPPGFGDTGAQDAAFSQGADAGNRGRAAAAQIAKLQSQVSSLTEQLSRVTAELTCEKKLREMEEQRLERIRQGMQSRQTEVSLLLSSWAKSLS